MLSFIFVCIPHLSLFVVFKLLIAMEFHGNTVFALFSVFPLLYHYLLFKHMTHTHTYTQIHPHMMYMLYVLGHTNFIHSMRIMHSKAYRADTPFSYA